MKIITQESQYETRANRHDALKPELDDLVEMCSSQSGHKTGETNMKRSILVLLASLSLIVPSYAAPTIPHSYPLFATDSDAGKIWRINDSSGSLTEFASGLSLPRGITYNSLTGYLFVGQENGDIYRFGLDGAKSLFTQGAGPARGLAFDATGWLYVGRESSSIISKISPDALTTNVFASGFVAQGLAFDSSGDLYAATGGWGDNRIMRIEPDGTVHTFATINANPVPVEFDLTGFSGGNLLTAENDTGAGRAWVALDSAGNIVRRVAAPDQAGLNGLAVTGDGIIWGTAITKLYKLDSQFNVIGGPITGFTGLFDITTVPEPSTASLLALGAAAAWRRRRTVR